MGIVNSDNGAALSVTQLDRPERHYGWVAVHCPRCDKQLLWWLASSGAVDVYCKDCRQSSNITYDYAAEQNKLRLEKQRRETVARIESRESTEAKKSVDNGFSCGVK